MVEHVTASEEQDGDQTDSSPEVAVLNDREVVRRGDEEEGDSAEKSGRDGDDLDIVDRADDRRVRRFGEVTAQPGMDGLSLVGTDSIRVLVQCAQKTEDRADSPRKEVETDRRRISPCVGASRGREQEQDRCRLQHQLVPVSHCHEYYGL